MSEKLKVYYPFLKLLKKLKINQKEAVVKDKRITYIVCGELKQLIISNFQQIKDNTHFFEWKIKEADEVSEEEIFRFLKLLFDNNILQRLQRKADEEKAYKYPKNLDLSELQAPGVKNVIDTKNNFIHIRIELPKSKKFIVYMSLIIAAIAVVLMFPLWPREVKIWAFYINLYLCIAGGVIMITRQTLHLVIRIFGYTFWLFPNFHEDVFLETFWPIYSIQKSIKSWQDKLIRIAAILSIIGLIFYFNYYYPFSDFLFDAKQVGDDAHKDLVEWGIDKIDNWGELPKHAIDVQKILEEDIEE